jgi:hypothetical protein
MSTDSMFATILAQLEADARERTQFRDDIKKRFEDGTERMDKQDLLLERIEAQTTKTNGRVTKLEGQAKVLVAKIAGGLLVLGALARACVWLYEHGYRVTP